MRSDDSTPIRSRQAVPLFAALSDTTRVALIARLSRVGPQSISALAEDATISRQAVTKHLRVMETAGLASSRRHGRERVFELRPEGLAIAHRYLEQVSRQWDAALGRLQTYLEEEARR